MPNAEPGGRMSEGKKAAGFSLARLLPLLLIGAGIAAFFAIGLNKYVSLDALKENRAALQEFVSANPIAAPVAFVALYAVSTALSLPLGAILTIAGGFLFGIVLGTVTVVTGATLGATILFLAVKAGLGDALRARAGDTLKRMEDGFKKDAFAYLLVLRLVPVFPFFLVNIAPAFLGVPLGTYVSATLIGIIPGSFVYASVGNGLGALFEQGLSPDLGIIFRADILIPIVGLAVLSLLPVVLRRVRGGKDAQ